MGLFSLNIGFDEHSLDLGNIRESFDLVIGDGSHQSGLTTVVASKKTVVLSTDELHLGVVKENLCTVSQSEGAVTQFLGILIIIVIIRDFHRFLTFDTNLFDGLVSSSLVEVKGSELTKVLGPLQILHEFQVHQGGGDGAHKLNDGQFSAFGILRAKFLLEELFGLADIATDGSVLFGQSLQSLQLSNSSFSDRTSLGVGNGFGIALQGRKEERQERSGVEWVVDKLGHVVNNNGSLTFGGGGLFAQSS
mmetsp:Transcript_21178/g.43569  ORF Transcript_21178/g.43569 Transcript_21178/m.43569 type:complete len:249 (+) Transcript_21178:1745-2491(+)